MRTKEHNTETCRKGNCLECLYENREPIVLACKRVQFSVKQSGKDADFKTETIDKPCDRIDGDLCSACVDPRAKWRLGKCNLATHLYHENKQGQPYAFITPIEQDVVDPRKTQQKLNPIKFSKRL